MQDFSIVVFSRTQDSKTHTWKHIPLLISILASFEGGVPNSWKTGLTWMGNKYFCIWDILILRASHSFSVTFWRSFLLFSTSVCLEVKAQEINTQWNTINLVTNRPQKPSCFDQVANYKGSLNTKMTDWAFVQVRIKGHNNKIALTGCMAVRLGSTVGLNKTSLGTSRSPSPFD